VFDAICFRDGATPEGKIDLGFMAEALIFYGKIHFVGNASGLDQLLARVGAYELLELLKGGYLEIHIAPDLLVTTTNTSAWGLERHDLGLVELVDHDPHADIRQRFLTYVGGDASHEKAASEFLKKIHLVSTKNIDLGSIRAAIIADPSFEHVATAWLRHLVPMAMPDHPRVEVWTLGTEFQIGTNIDFPRVSEAMRELTGQSDYVFNAASLISNFAATHEDVYYAAQLSAEISTSYWRSPMAQARFTQLWQRAHASRAELGKFSEATLGTGRAVGEAILEGRATFAQLLAVLDKRRNFREWLAGRPFDADLVKEYFAEVTKESWIDKLPNKTLRWALANSLGIAAEAVAPSGAGIGAALAVSAFDAFLLERIAKGWRPDQFVDTELKRLTRKD
jgi:hypothetical protein